MLENDRPHDAGYDARFERALGEAITSALARSGDSPVVEQVLWHFGLGRDGGQRRGKRLRPRLLIQVALDENGTFDDALDAALAVECLHNYSLVHDDVEDGDALRHGRASVWARYGVPHAVNAGDSMCAISYLTLLRNTAGHRADRVTAMATVLHAANLAMSAGQAFDLGFETAAHVTLDAYAAMIDGKTGVLFGAACELGALAAGAPDERARAYGELGRAYGRAFQIRDDVLGTWGSLQETGKSTRCDVTRRKWTYPLVWALAGPPTPERDAIARRYAPGAPLCPSDVAAVVDALDVLGAKSAAQRAYHDQLATARRLAAAHRIDRDGRVAALVQANGAPPVSCAASSMSSGSRGRRRKSTIETTSTRTTAVRIPSSIG